MPTVEVVNKTMELADCKDKWFLDEKHRCWCLEDILYTPMAKVPVFQRMSIFVPEPYMKAPGAVDPDGCFGAYTASTVPVVFENNSAGYMEMPHTWLEGPRCYAKQYLDRGFIYITCGCRGHNSEDEAGELCGKSPWTLVDLKTAIRFLRHNADVLPGDFDRIITSGWSAGGAMSTLLAVTGNSPLYLPYLKENGAFLEERDDVYAAQIYCPIIDLEHADLAYEWMFRADPVNESSPAGPAGTMTAFQAELSQKLSERYVRYFNGLGLRHPVTDVPLQFTSDGRGGTAYEYLMECLTDAATKHLRMMDTGKLDVNYTSRQYISGNYTYLSPVRKKRKNDDAETLMQGHAGQEVVLQQSKKSRGLGDMMLRPPKGTPYRKQEQAMEELPGIDRTNWLRWDGMKAGLPDLDTYVLCNRRRMKPCPSFDILSNGSGENSVFGDSKRGFVHFNQEIVSAIAELKDQFPEEYARYYPAYASAIGDTELENRIYLYNPLNFIGTEESCDPAKYYRIRVGSQDADTSFSISMEAAVKLANAGKDVDYALVWDRPHSQADYPGEVCAWIDRICGKEQTI